MKRKSIDAVPIWFVSKKIKPEKCITGDTLAPEKKALMITGDARGSQRLIAAQRKQKETVKWFSLTKLLLQDVAIQRHLITKDSLSPGPTRGEVRGYIVSGLT